jgi:REP element-mobilizing transposase RayT
MKTIGRQTERRDRGALFHVETGGSVYFLTFAARPGQEFSAAERALIMQSCKFGHPERWWLFGCVVMPDHVHMLLKPQIIQWSATGAPGVRRSPKDNGMSHEPVEDFRGANDSIQVEDFRGANDSIQVEDFRGANDSIRAPRWMAIGEIVKSIKSVTARQINQRRGQPGGAVWMTDYYERNVRDDADFEVKLEYLRRNPVKSGLVEIPEKWDALWLNDEAIVERGWGQPRPEGEFKP